MHFSFKIFRHLEIFRVAGDINFVINKIFINQRIIIQVFANQKLPIEISGVKFTSSEQKNVSHKQMQLFPGLHHSFEKWQKSLRPKMIDGKKNFSAALFVFTWKAPKCTQPLEINIHPTKNGGEWTKWRPRG